MNLLFLLVVFPWCLGTTEARHNRHRPTRKVSFPAPLKKSCRDPPHLATTLASWQAEMQISDPPIESFDEEWAPLKAHQPICDTVPSKGGKSSSIMDRAICPWQWRQNFDEAREPKVIAEAFCLCKHARGKSTAFCTPIRHDIAVLRRTHCDPVTGYYRYVRSTHSITIGCHSVFARVSRSTPMSDHYQLPDVEI